MTLAPRVEVFTQLSCNRVRSEQARYNRTHHPSEIIAFPQSSWLHHTTTLDPLGPHLHRPVLLSGLAETSDTYNDDDGDTQDPWQIPSSRCVENPAVQAGAVRLQMIMTTTMGLLTALTTGWWGQFGERHGRTTVLAIATFGLFLTLAPSLCFFSPFLTFLTGISLSSLSRHHRPLFLITDTSSSYSHPSLKVSSGVGQRSNQQRLHTSATARPAAPVRTYFLALLASSLLALVWALVSVLG